MAMVRMDGIITEIDGKGPGGIWRYDQCKQHLQTYPRLIDMQPSDPRAVRMKAFMRLMQYIRHHATVHFVQCWSHYANTHPRKNKKGETIYLTWHTSFISYNINDVVAGKPIQVLPPGYPPEP